MISAKPVPQHKAFAGLIYTDANSEVGNKPDTFPKLKMKANLFSCHKAVVTGTPPPRTVLSKQTMSVVTLAHSRHWPEP